MKELEFISKASARFVRISPRKTRALIDLIRGEKVGRALAILAYSQKRAKKCITKVLSSAISNAQSNPTVKTEELFISKFTADNGPMTKRFRAAAMGRATMIRHRSTHLNVELARVPIKEIKGKKQKRRRQKP